MYTVLNRALPCFFSGDKGEESTKEHWRKPTGRTVTDPKLSNTVTVMCVLNTGVK